MYSTRSTQAHASTALHHHDESLWRSLPAPDPFELIWHNLRMRMWERRCDVWGGGKGRKWEGAV